MEKSTHNSPAPQVTDTKITGWGLLEELRNDIDSTRILIDAIENLIEGNESAHEMMTASERDQLIVLCESARRRLRDADQGADQLLDMERDRRHDPAAAPIPDGNVGKNVAPAVRQ